jgi:hypothetical protein
MDRDYEYYLNPPLTRQTSPLESEQVELTLRPRQIMCRKVRRKTWLSLRAGEV